MYDSLGAVSLGGEWGPEWCNSGTAQPRAGVRGRRGSSGGLLKQESRAQLGAGAGGQGGAQPGAGARSGRDVGVGPLRT
jgi:hypothetical protein